MNINDIITHLGEERKNYFGAIAPPIIQSSNFAFDSVSDMRLQIADEINNHVYTRGNNPTVKILREKIAALESAEDALITSSGASAIAIAIMSCVSAGDHIICVEKPYSWTYKLITVLLRKYGVDNTFVEGTCTENFEQAIKPNTRLIFLESPNSLTFELQDLSAVAAIAKRNNITTIIDNSHCSPYFQNPIHFGIDIVVHSATKYINGHSDVVMGAVCGSKVHISKMFNTEFMALGVNVSPTDAAMAIRGLRTLPIRLERSNQSSNIIVNWLNMHPKVKKVIHPFSNDFPQIELARKQMKGNGGLFTLELNVDNKDAVYRFTDAIQRFLIAVSWGGYESLMIPSITFHDMPGVPDSPIPYTYIRFYIGLEDPDYLIADLSQALDKI